MGETYTTPAEAREQGRHAALAGRPVFVNPHIGVDAEAWFDGYHAVPESERGSRPDLLPKARLVRKKGGRGRAIGRGMHDAGVHALGDRCLPGSTPKPWSEI